MKYRQREKNRTKKQSVGRTNDRDRRCAGALRPSLSVRIALTRYSATRRRRRPISFDAAIPSAPRRGDLGKFNTNWVTAREGLVAVLSLLGPAERQAGGQKEGIISSSPESGHFRISQGGRNGN